MPTRRTSTAFTLIELLVVIAIIALLISILLPSLENARRQAKKSACLAHIKNIATSSRVYESDDPHEWGIPVHPLQFQQCSEQFDEGGGCDSPIYVGAYEWGGKSGIGRPDFMGGPSPLHSKYGTFAGFGPVTRPLNEILYSAGFKDNLLPRFNPLGALDDTKLELNLFRCPADNGPPEQLLVEDCRAEVR